MTVFIDRDEWKQNETNKKQETQEIIAFVGGIFKKEFGLSFVLTAIRPWNFSLENGEVNLDTNLETIRHAADTDYKKSDLVLGFTAKKLFRCIVTDDEGNVVLNNGEKIILEKTPCLEKNKIYYGGIADQPGKAAISEFSKLIAFHEIGHLFGAKHVPDSESIMTSGTIINPSIDKENKTIIQQRIQEEFLIPNAP